MPGDVLEIIGRHPGKSTKEIYALALRKASCEITCSMPAKGVVIESLSMDPVDLNAVVIGVGEPRTFSKKDGSTGEMIEAIIGDPQGTARLVVWAPELFADVPAGISVHITGAKPDRRGEGRAYSLDDKSSVAVIDQEIAVPFTPFRSVADQGTYSVQGQVKEAKEPRSFVTRAGASSWVRNIVITDGTDDQRIVLWGDKALIPVAPGDPVKVYHADAKPGRFGGIELGVGRSSIFSVPVEESHPVTLTGTIIAGQGCTFIDNGNERYIVEGEFPHGYEMRVTGLLTGSKITPSSAEPVTISSGDVLERLRKFRKELGSG
jgi:replication factor A1